MASAAEARPGPAAITVVHLITTLTQGGAERALSEVVPRTTADRHERHVVVSLVPGGVFADVLQERGIEVLDLGMRSGKDPVRGLIRLVRILRRVGATTVIAWLYHAALLATLASLFVKGLRVVWLLQGSLAYTVGLPRHTRATLALLARLSPRQEVIAANSARGIEDHRDRGFRPQRWRLVTNGCDTERFRPGDADRAEVRAELGVGEGDVLALFVGRNHPEKGPDLLLEAVAALPPTTTLRLAMVGSGTERILLEDGSEGRVSLLGERTDVERLLRGADLLVMPSRTEGTPNALLEAMASGVPCLATDVGDCRRVIGETGFVVPPEDRMALLEGLLWFTALPPHRRHELGRAARDIVVADFGMDRARADYRDLWTEA